VTVCANLALGSPVARRTPGLVDVEQARDARPAYSRFGKGRHVAGLSHGDCFAYALARTRGERLLFRGDDVEHTDISRAI
jgi:ribonuclease VapC